MKNLMSRDYTINIHPCIRPDYRITLPIHDDGMDSSEVETHIESFHDDHAKLVDSWDFYEPFGRRLRSAYI